MLRAIETFRPSLIALQGVSISSIFGRIRAISILVGNGAQYAKQRTGRRQNGDNRTIQTRKLHIRLTFGLIQLNKFAEYMDEVQKQQSVPFCKKPRNSRLTFIFRLLQIQHPFRLFGCERR